MNKILKIDSKLNQEIVKNSLNGFKSTGRALINVDYSKDFVDKNGALTCGEPAQLIEKNIVKVTKQSVKNGDYIVFALDNHQKNDKFHPESKLHKPHNIEGTEGRELYGELNQLYLDICDYSNVYYMNKTRYSAFCGTDLELRLRERNIDTVILVGVCTDICILHTAIDAYNRGFKVIIYSNAVASFNPIGHKWALEHMERCLGAVILQVA